MRLSNPPFFEKITAAHLMMRWGGGSKWKEGSSFFFKVMWSCTGHLKDALEKGSPPTCVFNPWFAAFCIQQQSREQPISSTCGHQLLLWPPPSWTSDTVTQPVLHSQALQRKWREPWAYSGISWCFSQDAAGEEQHPSAPWHSAGSVCVWWWAIPPLNRSHSTPLYLTQASWEKPTNNKAPRSWEDRG